MIGVNTIFSLYYYLRVVKVMYLDMSDKPAFTPNLLGLGLSALCALMLFAMLVFYGPVSRLTTNYGQLHLSSVSASAATDTAQRTAAAAIEK